MELEGGTKSLNNAHPHSTNNNVDCTTKFTEVRKQTMGSTLYAQCSFHAKFSLLKILSYSKFTHVQ